MTLRICTTLYKKKKKCIFFKREPKYFLKVFQVLLEWSLATNEG